MREQRDLLERESIRADDAEDELARVTAQADALSLKLDQIEESYARRMAAASQSATTSALESENDRLRGRVKALEEELTQMRRDIIRVSAAQSSGKGTPSSLIDPEERRTLLRELAEAKKDVALAKQARAEALAEAMELRSKLENASASTTIPGRVVASVGETCRKAPEWVDVVWDASYGGARAEVGEKGDVAVPTSSSDTSPAKNQATTPQLSTEDIDWDAAYAEIDATRASKKWSQNIVYINQ